MSLDSQLPTIGISKSTVLWKLTPATKIVSFRNIQTKYNTFRERKGAFREAVKNVLADFVR